MISSPVLHRDEEGKTLKSLAKMGVILGNNDIGASGAGNDSDFIVAPLRISRTPATTKVEVLRKQVPRSSLFTEEVGATGMTTKRDKRRGFVFDGLDGAGDGDMPPVLSKVADWNLHNLVVEEEEEEEEEDAPDSPVSSSCAHEADPVDSMRWSFVAPPSMCRRDSPGLKGVVEVVEVKQDFESSGPFFVPSTPPSMASKSAIKSAFVECREDLEDNKATSTDNSQAEVTNSGPNYTGESPTLGHNPTLSVLQFIETTRHNTGAARTSTEMTWNNTDTARNSIDTTRSETEKMIDRAETSIPTEEETNVEDLRKTEPKKRPSYIGIPAPEESLRAVLSSPTSRKTFSDYLDAMNSGNSNKDSNILRLWLAARAHSAALQYAAQLAEEIKATCTQKFPEILEPAQNTDTVEVSKIEEKVFHEMLQNDFPEFRRQSQAIPKEVQDSLDKLVAPMPESAAGEAPSEKKERNPYPISIIDNALAEQEASREETMLGSFIPQVSSSPPLVMRISNGHERKVQVTSSKHRSFHAVQTIKIDEIKSPVTATMEEVPEIPEIPAAFANISGRNSAPTTLDMPTVKPLAMERTAERNSVPITLSTTTIKPLVIERTERNATPTPLNTPTVEPLAIERKPDRNSAPTVVSALTIKPLVVERTKERSSSPLTTKLSAIERETERNPTPTTFTMPTLKPVVVEQTTERKSLVDVTTFVRSEIMRVIEPQPAVEKADLAAMGIVKKNRALLERMVALEGTRV